MKIADTKTIPVDRYLFVQVITDEAQEKGFTAVGHLTPFLDAPRNVPFFKTHADKMQDAIDTVRQYREAVGNDVIFVSKSIGG
jgi:hypothetical protein